MMNGQELEELGIGWLQAVGCGHGYESWYGAACNGGSIHLISRPTQSNWY